MSPRTATTSAPILDTLTERWSPRAFDTTHAFPEGALRGLLEAARWAPSANNTQPWRFIIARRGSETFDRITETFMGFNRTWAVNAGALIVNVAETTDAAGNALPWAEYDLGQAVAHLSVQATAEGLHLHQLGGFDRKAIRAAFDLEDRLLPVSISAIGKLGDADSLPEALREREIAPRTRLEIDELVLVRG